MVRTPGRFSLYYKSALNQVAYLVITGSGGDGRPALWISRSLFLIVAALIVAITSLIFLKWTRTRIAQLCSKCATQLICVKKGYDFFNVFPAKDMFRAASVKNNQKFSRFITSCRNISSTVCRIILLLTLLPLSSGWQTTRNVWYGASKLPTSTLICFCNEAIPEFVLLLGMLI